MSYHLCSWSNAFANDWLINFIRSCFSSVFVAYVMFEFVRFLRKILIACHTEKGLLACVYSHVVKKIMPFLEYFSTALLVALNCEVFAGGFGTLIEIHCIAIRLGFNDFQILEVQGINIKCFPWNGNYFLVFSTLYPLFKFLVMYFSRSQIELHMLGIY